MSHFHLSINLENDAIINDEPNAVARMLRETANQIESLGQLPLQHKNIKDANGNIVGTFVKTKD